MAATDVAKDGGHTPGRTLAKKIVKTLERKRNSGKKRRETGETGLDKRKRQTRKRNAKEKTVRMKAMQCDEHVIWFDSLKPFIVLKFQVT